MKLLGIDFETTGLDPQKDRVIEIGFAQWDTERRVPLLMGSYYVRHDPSEGVIVSPKVQKLTGILPEDLTSLGIKPEMAFQELVKAFAGCDYAVAHNGNTFDKLFFEAELSRLGLKDVGTQIPWIDTLHDVPYGEDIGSKHLKYLAAEHEFTNPFSHRALFDVLTMLKVLSHYDIAEVMELQKSPLVCLHAVVSFDDKQLAKDRGCRWDSESKRWLKHVKEKNIKTELKDASFEIIQIKI